MKFSLSYKVISSLLAFLVLLSTVSLAVEKHFCAGVLVDVAIFTKIDGCCAGDSKLEIAEITKKSCCDNEIEIVEGQDDLTIKMSDDLDDNQKRLLFAYVFTYINLYESLPKQIVPHKDYSPPLITTDIHVIDETFLI